MNPALKQRVATGVVLIIAVLLGVLLLPTKLFAIASLVILISIGGWEWGKLVLLDGIAQSTFVVALLVFALSAYFIADVRWVYILASVLWWLFALVLLATYEQGTYFYKNNSWLLKFVAFLVLVPAWVALITLHQHNPLLVLYLIFLVAITDSGAYFVGRKFGKKKLAPTVSPNKSVEGLYGGIATTVIIMMIVQYSYLNLTVVQLILFLVLSIITVFASVLGDLFESMIKRRAGIKDSGRVLPGHGGVLDRIDSLLAAAPIFAAGMYILKLISVDL